MWLQNKLKLILGWLQNKLNTLLGKQIKLGTWLAVVAAGALSLYVGYDYIYTQDGLITVNSPSVYTRQRLVNDRLSQTAWLKRQLDVTEIKENDFNPIDQVTVRRLKTGTNARGGNPPASEPERPDPTPSSPANESDGPLAMVQPTTSDLFRAKNTYRDEVRAEMMETQLDDRHDIRRFGSHQGHAQSKLERFASRR